MFDRMSFVTPCFALGVGCVLVGTPATVDASHVAYDCTHPSPELIRAMVLADKMLFLAGPADVDEH